MPIYGYRCANGHAFEVSRSMADDPLTECVECGAPVERVFHPPAVHYKGSGFYTTDYAKTAGSKRGGSDDSSGGADAGASESKDGDSKSDSKSSNSDASSSGSSTDD